MNWLGSHKVTFEKRPNGFAKNLLREMWLALVHATTNKTAVSFQYGNLCFMQDQIVMWTQERWQDISYSNSAVWITPGNIVHQTDCFYGSLPLSLICNQRLISALFCNTSSPHNTIISRAALIMSHSSLATVFASSCLWQTPQSSSRG